MVTFFCDADHNETSIRNAAEMHARPLHARTKKLLPG
jgi:hypothetical protein